MEKDAVPGLYNRYGNDCFANCVIQGLAGIPSFREYLRDRVQNDTKRELQLSEALWELLTGMHTRVHD
jgi:ubiquitin C-terminal hydrolase